MDRPRHPKVVRTWKVERTKVLYEPPRPAKVRPGPRRVTPGRRRTSHNHDSPEIAMIVASQLRAGMAIRYEGPSYKVIAAEYHPGQGKMGGTTHVRLQNTGTGTFWEHSFRSDLKLEDIAVEKRPLEFLYDDDDHCWFMNPENYEQTGISKAVVGPQAAFLEAGKRVTVEFVEAQPVGVLFPDTLEVSIAETAPPVHQQQDNTLKPAKLANGVEIIVPQFIKNGDAIRLDLRTMKYMDRVKGEARARHG